MRALIFAFALVLAAEPAGAKDAPKDIPEPTFTVAKSTMADVVAALGKPGSTYSMSDGTTIITYVRMRARVKGASYIPVVGLFASGAKSKVSIRTFTFGQDGLLRSFTTSDSSADCNASIAGARCR